MLNPAIGKLINDGSENPYLRMFRLQWTAVTHRFPLLTNEGQQGVNAWDQSLNFRKGLLLAGKDIRLHLGFVPPTDAALGRLAQLGPLIEIGAGTGLWASELAGGFAVDILAYDKNPLPGKEESWYVETAPIWYDIIRGGPLDLLIHPDRTLFLCYPAASDDMAAESLDYFYGGNLAYVANSELDDNDIGGKTFHQRLTQEWRLVDAVPLPGWLDFVHPNRRFVPKGAHWQDIANSQIYYGDHLFIFKRRRPRAYGPLFSKNRT